MAVQNRVDRLKDQVKQLRKSYAEAVASANKVVAKGLEKLADQELKAVRKHYEAALKDLKSATKKGNVRDVAQAQAKVLQDTLDRVVKSARESVGIVSDTSKELSKILQKAAKQSPAASTTRKKPAAKKKAPAKKKPAAKKPASSKKKAPAKKAPAKKAPARKTATARKRSTAAGAKPATRKRATARKKAG